MKRVLLVLVLCLLSSNSLAARELRPPQSRMTFSVGYSLLGSGDVSALTFWDEFSRDLSKRFILGTSIGLTAGKRLPLAGAEAAGYDFAILFTWDVDLYVAVVRRPHVLVRVGAGPSVLKWTSSYTRSAMSDILIDGDTVVLIERDKDNHTTAGLGVWADILFRLRGPMVFGIRFGVPSYLSGDRNPTVGIETGVTW